MREDVEFNSGGATVRGWLYKPDDAKGALPTVVMAGGWCYVREIVMPTYAEKICAEGIAVLLFDYRCSGVSDGSPRQHLDPWAQIEDYRNAMSFVESREDLDCQRIGIWGISYSGGHVLILAAIDPRVRSVVSIVPLIDGEMNLRRQHGEEHFARLRHFLSSERARRYLDPSHVGSIPFASPDPDNEICTFPAADVYQSFNTFKADFAPLHEHWSTVASTEWLLSYTVDPYLSRIINVPTCMIIAEGDNRTPWDLQVKAFNNISTPKKRLVVQPDVSHMGMYSDHSQLDLAARASAEWCRRHLVDNFNDKSGYARAVG